MAGMVCVVAKVVPSRETSKGAVVETVNGSLTLTVFITTYWASEVEPISLMPKSRAVSLRLMEAVAGVTLKLST